jgi:hypothetical protein
MCQFREKDRNRVSSKLIKKNQYLFVIRERKKEDISIELFKTLKK